MSFPIDAEAIAIDTLRYKVGSTPARLTCKWRSRRTFSDGLKKDRARLLKRKIAEDVAARGLPDERGPLPSPTFDQVTGTVPQFRTYYANEQMMNRRQRTFYRTLRAELDRGKFPSVEGNVSYLFAYTTRLFSECDNDPGRVLKSLTQLIAGYHAREPKFVGHAREWAGRILFSIEAYTEFLTLTEYSTPFGQQTGLANLRCNAAYRLNLAPSAVDLFKMTIYNPSAIVRKYPGEFQDALESMLERDSMDSAAWWRKLFALPAVRSRVNELADSYPGPLPTVKIHRFYRAKSALDCFKPVIRSAENHVRESIGVPAVGEGWVAETALYRAIATEFPTTEVVQHGRPVWLRPQHLDIWLPRWNLAVEYQGAQHFIPIARFGGLPALREGQLRDAKKAELCAQNNTELIIATESDSTDDIIAKIRRVKASR